MIDSTIPLVDQPLAIFIMALIIGPILFLAAISVITQMVVGIVQNGAWILFFALLIWYYWK